MIEKTIKGYDKKANKAYKASKKSSSQHQFFCYFPLSTNGHKNGASTLSVFLSRRTPNTINPAIIIFLVAQLYPFRGNDSPIRHGNLNREVCTSRREMYTYYSYILLKVGVQNLSSMLVM